MGKGTNHFGQLLPESSKVSIPIFVEIEIETFALSRKRYPRCVGISISMLYPCYIRKDLLFGYERRRRWLFWGRGVGICNVGGCFKRIPMSRNEVLDID